MINFINNLLNVNVVSLECTIETCNKRIDILNDPLSKSIICM